MRVGPSNARRGVPRDERTQRRGKHEEAEKKRKTRERQRAAGIDKVERRHEDYLIPQRTLDVTDDEIEHVGQLIAGVNDFKILRGSIAVLNLSTSVEFAHLLTDAAAISRGNLLVADLYQVKRTYVFGDDDAELDDAE